MMVQRQSQLIRLIWRLCHRAVARKGSIEVGGSLCYNGLVFAPAKAILCPVQEPKSHQK